MIAAASFVLEVRDYNGSHAWSAEHQTQKPICQGIFFFDYCPQGIAYPFAASTMKASSNRLVRPATSQYPRLFLQDLSLIHI